MSQRKWIAGGIAAVSLLLLASQISPARDPECFGRSDKAWRVYLEEGDSEESLEIFEKLADGRRAAPMEHLGLATILDSRERLDEAQRAYRQTLESVWDWIGEYRERDIEELKEDALEFRQQTEEIPRDMLREALWLWTVGSYALRSGDKIFPYSNEQEEFIELLRQISDTTDVPMWVGFKALQAEAEAVLLKYLLQKGRLEEAVARADRIGFVRDFLWIGPFHNKEESGFDIVFDPEKEFHFEAEYEGKIGTVSWKQLKPRPEWGYVDLGVVVQPPENSTAYALSFVYSDIGRPVAVELGHAGAAKVWLGGNLIVAEDAYHDVRSFQIRAEARLKEGWNVLLVKVCSENPSPYGFTIRLTTPKGRPLRGSNAEQAPIRFWSLGDPIPENLERWPAAGDNSEVDNWFESRLTAYPEAEREQEFQSIANWMAAAWCHYHDSLDENVTYGIDRIREAIDFYPSSSLFQRWAGLLENDLNRSLQAFEKAAQIDPHEVQALSELARHYLNEPYKNRAIETLDRAFARNADSPRLFCLKGDALGRNPASAQLAALAYNKAIELSPDYYFNYHRLATTVTNSISYERRIQLLEKARTLNRKIPMLRNMLVEALLQSGQRERAADLVREGLMLNPYDYQGYTLLAQHYRVNEEWNEANEAIAAALEIAPDHPDLNRLAGEIYHAQGEAEQARLAWERALAIRPNMPQLEEYLASVYEDSDDYYEPYRIDLEDLPQVADDEYPEAKALVLLDHDVQKVYPNGTSSRTIHIVRKALTDSGVNELKTHGIYFEPAQDKVRILKARVIRADGSVFDAPPPTIRSARGGGDLIYGDYSVQVLSFPSVDKGSIVDIEYELKETGKNIYSDYFGSMFFFGQSDPTVLCEYVLITPKQRDFHLKLTQPDYRYALPRFPKIDSLEQSQGKTDFFYESVEGKQRVWIWSFEGRPQIKPEPQMPTLSELVPYVKVSSFRNWEEMSQWYWALIEDQFLPDEQVRRKTEQVIEDYAQTHGLDTAQMTDLDIIKALNGYVNTQIRYLSLSFGIHGYKPHKASEIISAQYGDCKDKATLMLTMAALKGIEGRIALLRTSDRGKIDLELPSLGLFNHAIIYFPDVDGSPLILDGTAQFFGTTELPPGDQGVELLTIAPGGAHEFVDSPIDGADTNQAFYETRLELKEDGSATGTRRSDYRGIFNPSVRSIYQNRGKVKELVESQFGTSLPGTTVSEIELSDLDNYEEPEWIQFNLDIPRLADRPAGQENRLSFRPILFPMQMSRSYAMLPRREHELVLRYNWARNRQMEIAIPEGYRAIQLPQEQSIETPFGSLVISCRVEGNKIVFQEKLGLEVKTLRVPVNQYDAFREFCAQVDKAEEQAIVLEKF